MIGADACQPPRLVRAGQLALGLSTDRKKVACVGVPDICLIAMRNQLFKRELTNGFEHHEPLDTAIFGFLPQKALIDQRADAEQRVSWKVDATLRDHFGRREGETTGKHSEPAQQILILLE